MCPVVSCLPVEPCTSENPTKKRGDRPGKPGGIAPRASGPKSLDDDAPPRTDTRWRGRPRGGGSPVTGSDVGWASQKAPSHAKVAGYTPVSTPRWAPGPGG